jgi:hypothetical protein
VALSIRCGDPNVRLILIEGSGVCSDKPHRCNGPRCDNCWRRVWNRRIWATESALYKVRADVVWVGLLDDKDRRTARHTKERHYGYHDMLTTYINLDKAGLLSLFNMVPSRPVMKQVGVKEGLAIYKNWGIEYRPKRTRADWELDIPGENRGLTTATPSEITEMWKILGDKWGYKPGDEIEDSVAFERRVFSVLDDIRSMGKRGDGLYD